MQNVNIKLLSCWSFLLSYRCLCWLLYWSFLNSRCWLVLCNNSYRNLNLNLLVEVYSSLRCANLLHIAHCNNLTIDFNTTLSKFLNNSSCVY